jgi:hypothetical protein
VVEGLDLAGLGREQLGLAASLLDRLPRLGQLDLLGALGGDEECDSLVLELGCPVIGLPARFVPYS